LIGLAIARAKDKDNHFPKWIWVGIGINVILLSFFKFITAYNEHTFARLHLPQNWVAPVAGLAVPIGLSYVTFQMISYLVDVWKDNTAVEKNFMVLSAYLLFFPKLISGP
jgi:D-alanyl-lipoteichoic acid acyltransferase DltB (MBOAT superfamily)